MALQIIDANQAKEIARNFLQQHYSVVKVEKPVERDGVWIVKVTVSSPMGKEFEIKVNSKTGYILGF